MCQIITTGHVNEMPVVSLPGVLFAEEGIMVGTQRSWSES